MLRASLPIVLNLVAAALSGCASDKPFSLPWHAPCETPEPNLFGRGMIPADAPLPASFAATTAIAPPAGGPYVLMSAQEAQCRAAEQAVTAHLVDIERELAIASIPPRPESRVARGLRVHQQLLALRAGQIRNDAAGEALETFYQLAGAEASLTSLEKTLAHVRTTLGYLDELRAEGIQTPTDESELRRQELDLLRRRAELEWTIAQLNGQLRLLTGLCLEAPVRIWPDADFLVAGEPVDGHGALEIALASRADLAILRLLSATLDEATMPLVRGALQTRDATLGNVTSGFDRLLQLLRPARGEDELRAREAQLSALLVESERELTVAVYAAAGAMQMRRDQAVLAKMSLERARQQLSELRQMRDIGQATAFDVAAQEGSVLEAESLLAQKAAQWRVAQVKLRQAMGVLALECGFGGIGSCLPHVEPPLPVDGEESLHPLPPPESPPAPLPPDSFLPE
ncbi:MAG: hypothetical protein KY475_04355 [Planctomycetes bacterium]|nr:hypothetical protein [Planctomycetota bacterium]